MSLRVFPASLAIAAMLAVSAPAEAATVINAGAVSRSVEQASPVSPVYYHHRWRRHYYGPSGAAFAALALGLVGGAIASSQYDDCAWGGCYGYGYGGPYYGGGYYGGGGRHWHGGWSRGYGGARIGGHGFGGHGFAGRVGGRAPRIH